MLSVGLVVAILLISMFLFIFDRTQEHIISEVHKQAVIAHTQIVITRQWNTNYKGVYVEKTEGVVSNHYLKILGIEPDITTLDNRTFTLKNPALMTREISTIAGKGNVLEFHITSLDPVNPSNAPNEFEKESLISFKNGTTEASQMVSRNGSMSYQYIAPLYVMKSCLNCHKNFKVGDIGGGISVFLPMENAYAAIQATKRNLLAAGIFLIAGVEILLYSIMKKHIVRPIYGLTVGAKRMGSELEYRMPVVNNDEIGILSMTLNNLASDIGGLYDKLRRQNEFINLVIDSLPHPFYVINIKDHTIAMANKIVPVFKDGATCYAVSHKKTQPCRSHGHICPLEEVKETKKPTIVEHIHYDKGDDPRNIEIHCYPIFDNEGNVNQVIEYSLDITDKKRAEEMLHQSEEKYRTLYESSSDAIMLLDENGFLDCNDATLQIFGLSKKEDFIKIHPSKISPQYQPDGTDSITAANIKIAEAFRIGMNHFEWVHRKKNGEDFFADVLLTAFNFKGKQIIQMTVRDITKRKLMEGELQKNRDHLEQLVKERTAELEKKNEELNHFNRVFVGRELRMAELKKTIAEYEMRISEYEIRISEYENKMS